MDGELPAEELLRAVRAGARVEQHRVAAALARLEERRLELARLALAFRGEALRLERHPAAEPVEAGREEDVAARLVEERGHRAVHGDLVRIAALRAEGPGDAAREVDDREVRAAPDVREPRVHRARHRVVPDGEPAAGERPRRARDGGEPRGAEHGVRRGGGAERRARAAEHLREAPRRVGGDAAALRVRLRAKPLRVLARVDAHGAGGRAEPVDRAGLLAGVAVVGLEPLEARRILGRGLEPGDLAPHHDALARGQGEIARRALRLAEAALDAAVHDGVRAGERLQRGEVRAGVVVEDDARVEQAVRVEERLDAPHEAVRLGAPLQLHERRDVPARAVLALERPVVLRGHHRAHLVHEPRVALDLGLVAEVLREDEVQVPVERVAEDDRLVVAVGVQQRAAGRASPRRGARSGRRRPR